MCERCKDTPLSDLVKTGVFAGTRWLLYSKPIKSVADKIETSVGIPHDPSMGKDVTTHHKGHKKHKKKHMQSLMMDSLVYFVSAVAYDMYLYEALLRRIEIFRQNYAGFCPCELMKMLWLFAVQMGYDAATSGASIRKALADAVAIFSAEAVGNSINKMIMEKQIAR